MKPLLFGKYCLLERVSVGGMAEVFRAKPFDTPDFRGYLALKRILPHLAEDDEFIKMFVDEAKLTVQLNHPNIVRIYELGQFNQSYYILMEFISGKDLLALQKTMRRQRDVIPVGMAMFIASEMSKGLHYAHMKRDPDGNPLNIIHRDVSPQNVLIDYRGRVKVIDFGIAKAAVQSTRTQIGVLKGKMGYMSPEQVRGEVLDYRSDVFAIGTVLWEMLTNRRLFHAQNEFETMQKVRDAIADAPSTKVAGIPREVDEIVMAAITRDPEKRYDSAVAFADALDGWLAKNPFGPEELSVWMRTVYADDLDAERSKRDAFAAIVSPEDVLRLQEAPDEPEPVPPPAVEDEGPVGLAEESAADWVRPDQPDAPEPSESSAWVGGIAPEEGQDLSEFADQHTLIQAGGFNPAEASENGGGVFESLDGAPLPGAVTEPLQPPGRDVEAQRPADPVAAPLPAPVFGPPAGGAQRTTHAATTGVPIVAPSATAPAGPPRVLYVFAAICVLLLIGGVGAAAAVLVMEKPVQAPVVGALQITVTPPTGIEILVDGASVGNVSPLTVNNVAPGAHAVEVRHPEYASFHSTVEVAAGAAAAVTVELKPSTAPSGFLALRLPDNRDGMAVYLNGERQVVEDGKNPTFEVGPGRQLVEVLQDGFRPWSLITTVEPSVRKEELVTLEPNVLALEVKANAQSSVRFNRESIGRGVVTVPNIDPTKVHRLDVTYRGQGVSEWKSYVALPIVGGEALEVDFDKPLPKSYREQEFGFLQASSGDDWWVVCVDGVNTGLATPIDARSKLPITPGKHTISFERAGKKHEKPVEIRSGETFLLREKLEFEWDG